MKNTNHAQMNTRKETVHPGMKNKYISSHLQRYIKIVFSCESQRFGDMSCREVCLLSDIIETRWHSACAAQSAPKKNLLFLEIMTRLHKMIHRPRCEQYSTQF